MLLNVMLCHNVRMDELGKIKVEDFRVIARMKKKEKIFKYNFQHIVYVYVFGCMIKNLLSNIYKLIKDKFL